MTKIAGTPQQHSQLQPITSGSAFRVLTIQSIPVGELLGL